MIFRIISEELHSVFKMILALQSLIKNRQNNLSKEVTTEEGYLPPVVLHCKDVIRALQLTVQFVRHVTSKVAITSEVVPIPARHVPRYLAINAQRAIPHTVFLATGHGSLMQQQPVATVHLTALELIVIHVSTTAIHVQAPRPALPVMLTSRFLPIPARPA